MVWAVLRRTLVMAVTVFAASVVVFAACSALPGDTATVLLGERADPASVAALRHEIGTDRPLAVQYADWATGMLGGDFGTSVVTRRPVWPQIADRLQVTASLVVTGMALAVLLAVPLGVLASRRRIGPLVSVFGQLGMAVPVFVAGILLSYVFAVRLRVLPAGGYAPLGDPYQWVRHMALPALSLGLVQGAVLVRYVRGEVLEVMEKEYIRTALATGRTWWGALWHHGLRNAVVPVLTVIGVQFVVLLSGAVIVEAVFTLPGVGQMLLRAVEGRDLLLVQGVVMILIALVLVINYLVDLLCLAVDPRLRRPA
ncbi:ABC transporter permease [Actinomadura fibrosa]|uniref:ABC transporter permease n=1 Tax=Actinomadura fibrosa TaxID=111802 RepID=A0ABW2Y0C4_9ACTN|nr:ABC transporter permease [Actinomadura fibrosa]